MEQNEQRLHAESNARLVQGGDGSRQEPEACAKIGEFGEKMRRLFVVKRWADKTKDKIS